MALYLVTGIAGFIGSSIAHELVARGEQVRGLDNFTTGKRENLTVLGDRIELREGDIRDTATVAEACRGVDFVLHQAALVSVPRSVADPFFNHDVNLNGTLNLLIAARDAGVRRFVLASSSAVYGDAPGLPKSEAMVPQPISPYGVSKIAGEQYGHSFYRVYGLETVSLRYFNVFGPRQDAASQYSGVLARFITAMLSGQQPTIFGDGAQTRDFIYVDNVVSANLLACHAPSAEVAGHAFNIASGNAVTLNQTFGVLQEVTGWTRPPAYGPERPGDIRHSSASIALAQQKLGLRMLVDFEEGLRRTVEWYRTQGAPTVAIRAL